MGLAAKTPPALAWRLSMYPGAAEAGGCYMSPKPRRPKGIDGSGMSGRSDLEAARRARGQVRRYCAANGLNRLGTLTYAESCMDARSLRQDVAEFFRALRTKLGDRFAYLWTAEPHPGGHGLHVHFAVGRFIKVGAIRDAWGRGIVHIKLLGDLPAGSGAVAQARQASRYLSKYVSKDGGDGRPSGLHRYEVAQGFQPEKILIEGYSADHVIAQACGYMRQMPAHVWRSDEAEDWDGPPAIWVQWGNGR